jgi:hypothetical protein
MTSPSVRSLWTIHNDHGAQLTWQTGRHPRELEHPTIGSWVRMASVRSIKPAGIRRARRADRRLLRWRLHPRSGLSRSRILRRAPERRSKKPLPFITPAGGQITHEEQIENLSLLGKLNHIAGIDYPDDKNLRARIKSYELAFQMQTSFPKHFNWRKNRSHAKNVRIDNSDTKSFGEQCLVARRLVERGVRFVQIFHGGGGGGDWDAHSEIKSNHSKLAKQVDQPVAGLLKDLKQRGLLKDTMVVFGTEFGRSPGAEGTGRDHHPRASARGSRAAASRAGR